ncbi:MAG: hypothetical protein LC808_26965 [Actinobacteria bacterium]|nr:hypothetical protein [Actinomycetota bacterium]
MATAKRDLTNPPVQGHSVQPLDMMVAIAVRIAEREGLLLESKEQKNNPVSSVADGASEVVPGTREQGRRSA